MLSTNDITAKKKYIQPKIERMVIDFEISLQYTSPGNQPEGDPLGSNDFFKNDPFKTNVG